MGSRSSRQKVDKRTQIPSATTKLDTRVPTTAGTLTTPKMIQAPVLVNAIVISRNKIDLSSLDQFLEAADFSPIVNEAISFDTSETNSSATGISDSTKHHQKEPQDSSWDEKYFAHGQLSDVVADVHSQTHGCISSSVSEDVNRYIFDLHKISTEVDRVLQARIAQISAMEKSLVNQFIQEQDDIIARILIDGRSYADNYEQRYRELLEEFIAKLELELSIHLDELQKKIQADKDSTFSKSRNNIEQLTIKADDAKRNFHKILQSFAAGKRREITSKLDIISEDKTRQPLGYEQLRTLNLQIYSTVGSKADGQGCDNIPDREKFIKNIQDAEKHQPTIKRTVYLGSDYSATLPYRVKSPKA